MPDLTARLLAEIERREEVARPYVIGHGSHGEREAAYLAALRKMVNAAAAWKHAVVDDCWYTCAAATEERDGGETCSDIRRGGRCDCGLDARRMQILGPIAEALGVETNE